ncbi:MAG TPA: TetR/AcrR family transcriptional regulator [Nevskiaceae bacterium]|nr:TetR/AcrR family transcriptional regulator [Nevskiaceae bacterium]
MPIVVDAERRRREVGAVVANIIATQGLEAVTIRSVAAAAGFSTAVVSHYFSDKRDLLLYSYRIAQDHAYRRLDEAARQSPGNLERIIDVLLPCHEEARRDWLVWTVFWALAISDAEFSEVQREQFQRAQQRIAQLLRRVHPSLRAPAVQLKARTLLSGLLGLALQASFDREAWPPEVQRRALRELLRPPG